MARFIYFLGFALPPAVASDLKPDAPRDAMPSPGRCSLCKRNADECYRTGDDRAICLYCMTGIVHRSGARRVRAQPRTADPSWPLEKPAVQRSDLVGDLTWWDRQFV